MIIHWQERKWLQKGLSCCVWDLWLFKKATVHRAAERRPLKAVVSFFSALSHFPFKKKYKAIEVVRGIQGYQGKQDCRQGASNPPPFTKGYAEAVRPSDQLVGMVERVTMLPSQSPLAWLLALLGRKERTWQHVYRYTRQMTFVSTGETHHVSPFTIPYTHLSLWSPVCWKCIV